MTPAQLTTLKSAILADQSLVDALAAGSINVVSNAFNVVDSTFYVWKSYVPTADVFDAITWSNLTPTDAPDGTAAWTNRSLACQGKQFNIQTMLTGRESISGAKSNIRAGLQDALTNVPSGAGGALVNGGWPAVKAVLTRNATRGEKLFATGTGTSGSPASLVFEGLVGDYDVEQAMKA